MKLTTESKLFLGIFLVTGLIIATAMILMNRPAKLITKEILLQNAVHTLGPKDATVWLVEFSDFQCPACGQFYPVVKQLTEKYSTSLLFVYRNYPLPAHPMAIPAARAAEAANNQNKYWEMHDALFTNQQSLSNEFIASEAAALGLQKDTFASDMQSISVSDIIKNDTTLGDSLGIDATPTFYLNGKKLTLTTLSDLTDAVDQAITHATK
jgi:protein-disulfide isomerase